MTPGNGTFSWVVGPSVSMPSFSDLKSVKRSFGVTWSKSGVSALYICACAAAPGPGTWYCPEGRMFRAMIVRSLANALEHATRAKTKTTPATIETRRIPRTFSCLLSARSSRSAGRTLLDGPKG